MPSFEVEISGTPYEVDAPDQNSAVMGAQKYANDTAIGPTNIVRQAVRGHSRGRWSSATSAGSGHEAAMGRAFIC